LNKFKEVDDLRGDLYDVYVDIRRRMAPLGYLLVAGYPHFFRDGYRNACEFKISADEAAFVNELIDYGETAIQETTELVPRVVYVDVRPYFTRHELGFKGGLVGRIDGCQDGHREEWLYGARLPKEFSYHPRPQGQRAYARAFRDALERALEEIPIR
jgi:hypothetical protein